MELKLLPFEKSLKPAYLKQDLVFADVQRFKSNLITLFKKTDDAEKTGEHEEHFKNIVSDFLKDTYYKSSYELNINKRKDLVIRSGKSATDPVGVIIEAKRPGNKAEMISKQQPNVKALHELIHYYMEERLAGNHDITYLIATNAYEWFVFDAQDFEQCFYENKKLLADYKNWKANATVNSKTNAFYATAKQFVDEELTELTAVHISLPHYKEIVNEDTPQADEQLINLYKIFSPEHLLKKPFANDSNSLNKAFYNELLHIIGLEEVKESGKKLIARKPPERRDEGSLLENAINYIWSHSRLNNLSDASLYGETEDKQMENIALELCIVWLNRILFLKLLEAQLIKYHNSNDDYAFLNLSKIKNYDDLDELFFEVLASKLDKRSESINKKFGDIPYLNSSLFEPNFLELNIMFISSLKGRLELPLYPNSVLKNTEENKQLKEKNTLHYLFEFLSAYNFASDSSAKIQHENKTLINASVLGLIFEKINGYKDGSFFTPGFITMYMCRETIRRAVAQKFKEKENDTIETFDDVKSYCAKYFKKENIARFNGLINELKICDPAVGSGHFLVSALNELIAIKSELNILTDSEGTVLPYDVRVDNDELAVISQTTNLPFEYRLGADGLPPEQQQKVQETLFREKREIIENSLFGVDLNPKSVLICRLRLWIELLKNAYYNLPPQGSKTLQLETLPNIDINIKCGNSLISRFPLDTDLKQMAKSSRWNIGAYQIAVETYKKSSDKKEKHEIEKLLIEIKKNYIDTIQQKNPLLLKFNRLSNKYYDKFQDRMFLQEPEVNDGDSLKRREEEKKKLANELKRIKKELEDEKFFFQHNNAFEWRFEFPEVLDQNGTFLGFDVVIGNPPYGVSIKGIERIKLTENLGSVPDYEIYYWFINRANLILKNNGDFSYIIPNTILFNLYAQNYRLSLFKNWHFEEVLDCTDINIFMDATVRNIILSLKKAENGTKLVFRNTKNINNFGLLIERQKETFQKEYVEINNHNWGLIFKLDKKIIQLIFKIKKNAPLATFFDVSQGYIPYRTSDLIKEYGKIKGEQITKNRLWHSNVKLNDEYKQEIFGRNISKYGYVKSESYVWYGKHLACYVDPKFFNSKRVLVQEITNPTIVACLLEEEFVNDPQLISVINKKEVNASLEFLWGLLNSKLATFYHFNSSPKATKGAFPKILVYDINNFPIPKNVNLEIEHKIINQVNEILDMKKEDPTKDTTALEAEIDRMVYELYGLTEEEIRIVEGE